MGFETCLGEKIRRMPRCTEVVTAVDSRRGSVGGDGCYRPADRQGWRWRHTQPDEHTAK